MVLRRNFTQGVTLLDHVKTCGSLRVDLLGATCARVRPHMHPDYGREYMILHLTGCLLNRGNLLNRFTTFVHMRSCFCILLRDGRSLGRLGAQQQGTGQVREVITFLSG